MAGGLHHYKGCREQHHNPNFPPPRRHHGLTASGKAITEHGSQQSSQSQAHKCQLAHTGAGQPGTPSLYKLDLYLFTLALNLSDKNSVSLSTIYGASEERKEGKSREW